MQWHDEGIVLGCRRVGETGVVLELMTRAHGRHAGWVHGGRSRRLAPILQPGNTVAATWRARLDEQLGHFTVEATRMRAASLIDSPLGLYGLAVLASHLRLLPERDPHETLFEAATHLADTFGEPDWAADFVRFELLLLAELGFGLDLSTCAATGATADLAYVSPKSGRAVGRQAGAAYACRLLALPAFLAADGPETESGGIADGIALTAFFLERHVYAPRGETPPPERARLVARLGGEGAFVSGMFTERPVAPGDSNPENEA